MELSSYAFQYKPTSEQLAALRAGFKAEREWGIFEDGTLKAKLGIIPLEIYLHGEKVKMGGIASVASWPEERRKGHVAKLLTHALEQMKQDGQAVSLLAPFSFNFYRKFGWEMFSDQRVYKIAVDQLPARTATEGQVRRHAPAEAIAQMQEVYEAYAPSYNGMVVRHNDWWQKSVLRNPCYAALYYRPNGKPGGYLLYSIEQQVLTVKEMIYLDETARKGLWTFIANHDSMIKQVVAKGPADDWLPLQLADPRIGHEIMPYFMARIVDLPAFVAQYRFQAGGEAVRLRLQVEDIYAPWNDGEWILSVSAEGEGALAKAGAAPDHEPVIRCTIQILSAMMIGYQRPDKLWRGERFAAAEHDVERLERLLPQRQTYLLDYF